MPSDPHKPLRDDVRLLGDLLGQTLKAQAGAGVFTTVERVRALSKRARAGEDADFGVLADELARVAPEDVLPVARAFTHFLHLANIAEQHHRVRRRRAHRARTPSSGCSPAESARRGSISPCARCASSWC
jgi:phosphoenolpyruvate carboxylase